MNGADGKEQTAANDGKFKFRALFGSVVALLFLIFLLVFPSMVPLEFNIGHRSIRFETGIAERAPMGTSRKFLDFMHLTLNLTTNLTKRNPDEDIYQMRLGRCFFRLQVQTKNTTT